MRCPAAHRLTCAKLTLPQTVRNSCTSLVPIAETEQCVCAALPRPVRNNIWGKARSKQYAKLPAHLQPRPPALRPPVQQRHEQVQVRAHGRAPRVVGVDRRHQRRPAFGRRHDRAANRHHEIFVRGLDHGVHAPLAHRGGQLRAGVEVRNERQDCSGMSDAVGNNLARQASVSDRTGLTKRVSAVFHTLFHTLKDGAPGRRCPLPARRRRCSQCAARRRRRKACPPPRRRQPLAVQSSSWW